jgi:integrase
MNRQVMPVDPEPISPGAARLIRQGKAANTQTAYRKAKKDFEEFCADRGLTAFPGTPATVMAYLECLAGGNDPTTIAVKVAGICYWHRLNSQPDPTQSELVRAMLAGIRRDADYVPDKKSPVLLDDLRVLVATLSTDLAGERNRALLLVGWAGAFRRSELSALTVADVRLEPGRVTLRLRRSKTDQTGKGRNKVIPALADPNVCPVVALNRWLDASAITAGPLFRQIDRWGKLRPRGLSGHAVAEVIKRAAGDAGFDPARFSGHSLRSGYITQAERADVPEWKIQQVTGHKSTQTLRGYIQDAGMGQIDAVKKAFGE